MAAAAQNDEDLITGINVTPLVDITLVLLVILMVTASYVASKTTATLRERVRKAHAADAETRAVIAADGAVNHARVVRVIDLLRRENVTKFASNVDPEELAPVPARRP